MELRWTKTALNTLDTIAEYINQDDTNRAKSFVTELRDKTKILVNFPGIGKAGRINGTRELVIHENYRVIYRVSGDELQILRIQHVKTRR